MGYAILHTVGQKAEIKEFSTLDVHKMDDQYARLQQEFFFIQKLIDKWHPTCLAIETQFVDKNPQTMIKIVLYRLGKSVAGYRLPPAWEHSAFGSTFPHRVSRSICHYRCV